MIFKPGVKGEFDRAVLYLTRLFEKRRRVKIETVTETRTLSQNSYIWTVFTHLAMETGSDKQSYYDYYLKKFPVFGELVIYGEIYTMEITMSHFSKEQMSYWINEIAVDARQEGFDIPEPETHKALEMYQEYKNLGMI